MLRSAIGGATDSPEELPSFDSRTEREFGHYELVLNEDGSAVELGRGPDVVKLYELLKNAEQTEQIGRQVLRAVIKDILRSRLAGTNPLWCIVREGPHDSSVITVLQGLLDSVTLTEEERKILTELEKE